MPVETTTNWSEEMLATIGEIELCHQTIGVPGDEPILLVMGLGSQMVNWPGPLCEELARRGFFVVRFDNRDCGRSTVLDHLGRQDLRVATASGFSDPPYLLSDIAADAAGLLDHLGIGAAHVVGASMGGMIGQTLAIERPERVRSLCSIMSTTGDREVGGATDEALEALYDRPPPDREGYVEWVVRLRAVIGSPGFDVDEAALREFAGRSFDRGIHPDGTGRQLIAILATGDRTAKLREIEVPTVVVHGVEDPLIGVSGGRATAAAIPGAELVEIAGMGHDLPPGTWGRLVEAIVANARG